MTSWSARIQMEQRKPIEGICMPTVIDAMLPVSELPSEYYDLFYKANTTPGSSYNDLVTHLIEDFFKVKALPDTDTASVANFTAFGASPQLYMPDAPYEYPDADEEYVAGGVTPKQFRFVELLSIARNNNNLILFSSGTKHVKGLEMIDEGSTPERARYVVRDFADIQGNGIYGAAMIAGFTQTMGYDEHDVYIPLPGVKRSHFPNGQSSYELTILPPDPKL